MGEVSNSLLRIFQQHQFLSRPRQKRRHIHELRGSEDLVELPELAIHSIGDLGAEKPAAFGFPHSHDPAFAPPLRRWTIAVILGNDVAWKETFATESLSLSGPFS